jgi:hypothetical protein
MRMFGKHITTLVCLFVSVSFAQHSSKVSLGRLQSGATVSFVRAAGGDWGIQIANGITPWLTQQKPARIEVFRTDAAIRELAAG